MDIQVLSSEIAFEGEVFDVRVDHIKLDDGRDSRVDVVVHSGAVALIPIDEDGSIWFVRQYRHAVASFLLELPAGTLEVGESPRQTASRECREEIGMAPGRLEEIGGFFLAPGYSDEYMHVFVATDLQPGTLAQDPDEVIEAEKLTVAEILSALGEGAFGDAKTIAALQMANAKLGILS